MNRLKVSLNSDTLEINKKFISIFASGISIRDLKKEDFDYLKQHTFTVSTNYPLSLHEPTFSPHLHVWSDIKTSKFLENHYKKREKDCLLMSRDEAFDKDQVHYDLVRKVDYWFDGSLGKTTVRFTLFFSILVIRKIYKDIPILLFGLDGFIPDNTPCVDGIPFTKWYDYYINTDRLDRSFKRNKSSLDRFVSIIEEKAKNNELTNVYNCSMNSRVRYLTKKEYRGIIGL